MDEAKKERKKNFLIEMLLTGIYGLYWPDATYVIVIVKKRNGTLIFEEFYESLGQHAEMNMLSDPKFLQAVKTGEVDIIVTSNYSPCWVCASRLETFYTDNKDSIQNFTIRFSFLYKIDDPPNRDGLKNRLNKDGIILKSMNDNSWKKIGVRFDKLESDRNWEEKIKEKQWFLSLGDDWKKTIRKEITKRDDETRIELQKLLSASPAVEDFEKKMTSMHLQ